MKTTAFVTCLLIAVTVVRGFDEDTIVSEYLEYLMPDIRPCADEFKMSEEAATNVQYHKDVAATRTLGCVKACVMKRMKVLGSGTDFNLEPIYKMIDVVHANNPDDHKLVMTIAQECAESIKGEPDECVIGNKYTDCYVEKLFN
ncbi:uncharacterized protein LOC108626480 [Ceratina calcarata]|uniref:Uncharacterized protein LOC108626480 n=1 Tax=Ceratina calcarata TaxID=156304 RepID=A0AAJ7J1P7_9HYME|nr:uncharacterized protein LOC108626480 [Ceratina calcarata]